MKAQGNHTDFTRSRSGISPEATNRYEYLLHESSQETFLATDCSPLRLCAEAEHTYAQLAIKCQ
jgi:hypothetical protein